MPLKRNPYSPDFYPDNAIPEWQDMGESQQVNIAPAVGAFKQRFMGNRGDMNNVPNPGMNDLPEMDSMMPDNAGGAPMKGKGLKSL
jgi:hypothetical protein